MALQRVPAVLRAYPKLFYGWVVLAGASLLAFVVVGVGYYGLAVLFDGLGREHGWPSERVALATTLFFVTSGVAGAVVGRGVDRFGPRVFFIPGASIMALALVWIGHIDDVWQLNLAYPLLAIGYSMAGSVPNNALVTRWFVRRRTLAMSLSQTGISLSGIILVPVTTALIIERGVGTATQGLALLLVVSAAIATLFLVRSSPESVGQHADGRAAPAPQDEQAERQQRVWSTGEVFATRAFWVLLIAFSGILLSQVGMGMHQLAMLRERLEPTTAALAVSTTAAASIAARLLVGKFAERWNKRRLGCVLMATQAVALLMFAGATSHWMMFAASVVFGFTLGNIFMLPSLIVGELFGMKSFGKVFGMLQLVTQTASGLGPYVLSLSVASFGGYQDGLLPLAGLSVASALVLSRLRPPSDSPIHSHARTA